MVVVGLVLVLTVVGFGVLFFRLHTLPERIAHKSQKIQFEIVAVLGLIALFTHMHIFWVAGLLLALIDFPDFGTSLVRIASSTEKMAGIGSEKGAGETPPEPAADVKHASEAAGTPPEKHAASKDGNGALLQASPAGAKELSHA